jgi:uracil-DNA glycosylase
LLGSRSNIVYMKRSKTVSCSRVVCFVGISGKPGVNGPIKPLSEETLSGRIISRVETKLRTIAECSAFFRDNLVKHAPLHNGKLRYPSPQEMQSEWGFFEQRLAEIKSNIVILLGRLVADFYKDKRKIQMIPRPSPNGRLLKWAGIDENGAIILAVAHPSYVGVYARKQIDNYAKLILQTIRGMMKEIEI